MVSTQKSASRVLDSFHESTYRLYQSMMHSRYMNPRGPRDVGDVRRLNRLVHPVYLMAAEQIWVHLVS